MIAALGKINVEHDCQLVVERWGIYEDILKKKSYLESGKVENLNIRGS